MARGAAEFTETDSTCFPYRHSSACPGYPIGLPAFAGNDGWRLGARVGAKRECRGASRKSKSGR
jgi:hypothetical protein